MDVRLFDKINDHYLQDEEQAVAELLAIVEPDHGLSLEVYDEAAQLVETVRAQPDQLSPLERFLNEYDLATEEGVLLMCLAETLLRIPDSETADALIADKLKSADWLQHIGSKDFMVNASTWGLMLTGKLLPNVDHKQSSLIECWKNMLGRLTEPVIRNTIMLAMRIIGEQFVLGETINKAIERVNEQAEKNIRNYECFSFDMLGEAALTEAASNDYLLAYAKTIDEIGLENSRAEHGQDKLSISVKLSALCPRFEVSQRSRAVNELTEKLLSLAVSAKKQNIQLTVDAEESERLELTLEVFEEVLKSTELDNWNGLGIAVQAYQKRAISVLNYLNNLAKKQGKVIPVRLVKGAYWDTEIKQAQVLGLENYPVYTRKCNTDISYYAAVKILASYKQNLFPQFATHNAQTVAYVKQYFSPEECEFQRLHGMGEALYDALNSASKLIYKCRVYAPVGSHESLLPYLIRRLLENGANSSFVHRIADAEIELDNIIADPIERVKENVERQQNTRIKLPENIFDLQRKNSKGINFSDRNKVDELVKNITAYHKKHGDKISSKPTITDEEISIALDNAYINWQTWNEKPAEERANVLEKAADLFQQNQTQLISLCIYEAGKTIADAHNELREAIDLLRYYAKECRRLFTSSVELVSPVGELNQLGLRAKGVFCCISPWNFPIAIYTGQIAAALAAGNAVLAKPSGEVSATAQFVTELIHKAGVPKTVLNLIPTSGRNFTDKVLFDSRIAGVAFTGSNEVAKVIDKSLARKEGAISTLIAETGGINAMLVDSSALPEQVVKDVVYSAFNSAGQRCSSLRVLYLQEEIADNMTELITGRMRELVIGEPDKIETDVGPVINHLEQEKLLAHIETAREQNRLIYQKYLGTERQNKHFVPPSVVSLNNINELDEEVFGPILHIIRYDSKKIEAICDEINNSGYGLTFGIHSRINHRVEEIVKRMRVGNVYINRNMVGAVVGSQPFGGCGLSGTGPKAGGPNYLQQFATEQTISTNTSAIGGNASLLSMDD